MTLCRTCHRRRAACWVRLTPAYAGVTHQHAYERRPLCEKCLALIPKKEIVERVEILMQSISQPLWSFTAAQVDE